MDRKKMKQYLILITYGILLFVLVYHFSVVKSAVRGFFSVFLPVLYGFILAFLVNIPYKWFRLKVFRRMEEKNGRYEKAANVLSIVAAYVAIGLVFAVLIRYFIPQLVESLTQLVQNIPYYITVVESFYNRFVENFELAQFFDLRAFDIWDTINEKAGSFLSNAIPYVGNYFIGVTSSLFNWLIGIVISIYFLFSKDNLIRQINLLLEAYAPKKHIPRIRELSSRTNVIFNRFISGDLIDAIIVGVACFIGTSIMQTPYALLISVIIGITNIIPIFGPFIGAIPSLFLIVIVDPFKALLFLIFILVLQQIDGNIIKPHVFGNTLGLPSLWVLISIVIGGGLFGIIGMILGVPIFALAYSIVKESVHSRLNDDQ